MPSLGLGLGLPRAFMGSGLDSDVLAFAAESGATDLNGLNDLVKYLKGEGLYSNFVIYPMKSAQNAGSGATVYSLGDLTNNNMTLGNEPSWGATGITYDGVDQNGQIADFLGAETVTMFARISQASATPTALNVIFGQYDTGGDERPVRLAQRGNVVDDPYRLLRSASGTSGTSGTVELATGTGSNGSTSDRILVAQWVAGGGRSLWIDKAEISLTVVSDQTSKFNSSADVTFFSSFSSGLPSNFAAGLGTAFCVATGTLTTDQRESITDDLNAL